MRFALFCDGAYSKAIEATVVPIHVLVTTVEVEVVRAVVVVVVVRRRTPKEAAAGIVER